MEPTINYTEPTINYTEPMMDYTEPTMDYTEPTMDYTEPTMDYTEPVIETASTTINQPDLVEEWKAASANVMDTPMELAHTVIEIPETVLDGLDTENYGDHEEILDQSVQQVKELDQSTQLYNNYVKFLLTENLAEELEFPQVSKFLWIQNVNTHQQKLFNKQLFKPYLDAYGLFEVFNKIPQHLEHKTTEPEENEETLVIPPALGPSHNSTTIKTILETEIQLDSVVEDLDLGRPSKLDLVNLEAIKVGIGDGSGNRFGLGYVFGIDNLYDDSGRIVIAGSTKLSTQRLWSNNSSSPVLNITERIKKFNSPLRKSCGGVGIGVGIGYVYGIGEDVWKSGRAFFLFSVVVDGTNYQYMDDWLLQHENRKKSLTLSEETGTVNLIQNKRRSDSNSMRRFEARDLGSGPRVLELRDRNDAGGSERERTRRTGSGMGIGTPKTPNRTRAL
ncbi:hypothetical protein PGT21_034993 [Puccinia graminis f. sp. tritici]|uniref:Uncharacterized protein n=1 Tax=Puccinia graminis f. sp. tritici TaxID=56615 RepID=A0A5B0MR85_PUCGR|nr:hypothetical protein PGT21_034993 [Puccinia graminis f. sp. tritici]